MSDTSINNWVCIFDLENSQNNYAMFMEMISQLENHINTSLYTPLSFQGEFIPFCITRAPKNKLSNRDTLLDMEVRLQEVNSAKYSKITSVNMLLEGLRKAGGLNTFNYYLRIHLNNNETDIVELQSLVLMLQALPSIQNRLAVRLMEVNGGVWTTSDYFRVSDFLYFVQNRYRIFFACYDSQITSLRVLSHTRNGIPSTFLPVLEVDNRLCQLLNKSWTLIDTFSEQPFNKLHTALVPQGCDLDEMTRKLFQIGLSMLFDSLPGNHFRSRTKKKELLTFLVDLVREMQGITPLDVLLFGALAGDKLKNQKEWNRVKAYMGNIQIFSLAINQILENITNHSEYNLGVFTFRLQRNTAYLGTHYPGYTCTQKEPCLEIMIADSNKSDGIVDHFLKSSKADQLIKNRAKETQLAHLFGDFQDPKVAELWRNARKNRPEMCHGLLSFFSCMQTLKGAVLVRSLPQTKSNTSRDMFYYNGTQSNVSPGIFFNRAYIPGTQFSLVVNRPESIDSLKNKEDWKFDFDTLVYATTYRELALALRFNKEIHNLTVHKFITASKRTVQSQAEKDEAVLEWKEWFDEQYQKAKKTKHEVFQCDLSKFCQELEENHALGEPFCKGFLSSRFFIKSKQKINLDRQNNDVFCAVLFQNPSAQFSRYFVGTLQVMVKQNEFDLSHVSVYFYPKQYEVSYFPYCATTLHQLLGIPINEREFPRIFPYTLFLQSESGHCLFEEELYRQANSSIYNINQGFKLPETHMRLGNKVHLDSFYEMALFFENPNYAYYTAFLLLRILIKDYSTLLYSQKHLLLYGYASYSRSIVWAFHQILEEYLHLESLSDVEFCVPDTSCENLCAPEVEFAIYQNDLKLESDQPQSQMYFSRSEWQHDPTKIWEAENTALVMIVPISSSLTTFNKMKSELDHETQKNFQTDVNFTAFWVRNHFAKENEPTWEERAFWRKCDPAQKTIDSPLVSGKIHYLRYATCEWSDPLECRRCFPQNALLEYPLVETDPTSTIPTQQFYLEPFQDNPPTVNVLTENDARVARLRGNILYGHISKGSNHYQYYIKPRTYFLQEREEIVQWLTRLREHTLQHDPNISAPNRINVLIMPQQIDNVEFGQYVYEHYFRAHAECIVINTEKEFRSNLQAEYSGLFHRLISATQTSRQTVKFYYVDNSVCSGNSFNRAMSLISSCMNQQDSSSSYEFQLEKVFLLISRLSEASKRAYVKDPSQNFHAYVEIHISAIRTFGDSCIPCKVQWDAQQYYKKAATKAISSYWERKSYTRKCISFDQFDLYPMASHEQDSYDHQQEEGFRRMICSHRAAYYIRPIQGKEKEFYFLAIRSFLKELCTENNPFYSAASGEYRSKSNENQKGWVSAGLKVLARPFFTFDYRLRCVVMDLFLLLSDFLIKGTDSKTVRSQLHYLGENDKKDHIKSYLLKNDHIEWCAEFSSDLRKIVGGTSYQLLVFIRDHILKGLADIKSNYLLRQDTMIQISNRLSTAVSECGLSEDTVEAFFDHYLRSILRITHSSSDETKGVWLEHLLQYGQEYTENKPNHADGIEQMVAKVPENVQKPFRSFLETLLVENNRPIYQAVVSFSKQSALSGTQAVRSKDAVGETFLDEYHMRNAKTFLSYGYNQGTSKQLSVLINLLQPGRSKENYKHRYESLGEDLKNVVCSEAGCEKSIVLFGKNAENSTPISKYLNLSDYFTLFPSNLHEKDRRVRNQEQSIFEEQWWKIKNNVAIQADLEKNGFSLMMESRETDKFNIIIKLDNNFDDLTESLSGQLARFAARKQSISIQKIDPVFIYIPCALPRQKALCLTRKILMFRGKLVEWLEKDFNNNAIAVLSQQQYIAKLLSTDKMGDHAENDFVECQQQLLLATDETDFEEELNSGNWKYAASSSGQREDLYDLLENAKPPLQNHLSKAQDWFFLRSYVNSRIARLFRTMVRTANEIDGGDIIDAENYYARSDQSVLMRPVYDLGTVFFTPVKPGYIRKNYLKKMLEVVTFEVEKNKDYGNNLSADIRTRMQALSQDLDNFICISLQSEKTGREYAYLSEYLAAILMDCFVSAIKAGKVWNEEGWGGDAYCELAKKDAHEKCKIEVYREHGGSFAGYDYDYLVIRNEIHHTPRAEKKGPGMSQAAIRWYIEGLWRSCVDSTDQYPKVVTDEKDGKYIMKLPILKRKMEGDSI